MIKRTSEDAISGDGLAEINAQVENLDAESPFEQRETLDNVDDSVVTAKFLN